MTELQCPYCGAVRSTSKTITARSKLRCPNCNNIFRPTVQAPPADEYQEFVTVQLDEESPPPPTQSAPFIRPPLKPDKPELYGYRVMPVENSRKIMAGIIGIGLTGLIMIFVNWYAHQVRVLDKMADKAAYQHISKIKKFAAPLVKNERKPAAPPALPVVQQKVVPPQPASPSVQPAMRLDYAAQLKQQNIRPAPTLPVPLQPAPLQPAQPAPRRRVLNLEDEKKATSKLYLAKKLEKEGKGRLANKLYQEILDTYPDTDAAEEAQKHAGYSLDKRVERAAKLLSLAQGFERMNSFDEAIANYEELVSLYPETEQAKTAQERLKVLNKK
ncbi:MAG: hypothetical protein ACLQU5_00830 [Isosphaeraceae bacterium]